MGKRLFFVNIVQNKVCFAKVGELFIALAGLIILKNTKMNTKTMINLSLHFP